MAVAFSDMNKECTSGRLDLKKWEDRKGPSVLGYRMRRILEAFVVTATFINLILIF